MYYLIETTEQLKQFELYNYKEAFIEIIPNNNNTHPVLAEISLIYLKPLNSVKGFMLCVNHSESFNLSLNDVEKFLENFNKLYTRDKKYILHLITLKNLWDISYLNNYEISPTTIHKIFNNKFSSYNKLNNIIPISKHYELCEKIFDDLQSNIKKETTKYEEFFNNKISIVFNAIERNGIKIDKQIFEEYFYFNDNNFVYTNYNNKTHTTRPSNSWNGVNYTALKKDNGCRKAFIPRNDYLLEMDITAYHPTLISSLINYKFPDENIHGHFAELYGVNYDKAKQITFKQLYGGVFEQYKDIPFFKKVIEYTDEIWNKYETKGYLELVGGRKLFEIENPTPQKLLNYKLQSGETFYNVHSIKKLQEYLANRKSNIILYSYDAFLINYSEEDGKDILKQIKIIIEEQGFQSSVSYGKNYNNLTKLK